MDATALNQALGGPVGRRALRDGSWFRPAPWVFAVATLNWVLLVLRQRPCITQPQYQYPQLCYSDIQALWGPRGIKEGLIPYLQVDLEYPVLTGGFIWLTRAASGLLPGDKPLVTFFGLSALLLFVCFLGLVGVHLRLGGATGALMVAASPVVLASGLINWDMLPVLLTSAAVLAWAQGRPGWSGALLGLGAAAKLYPVLLLVPLGVLCARAGRWRALGLLAAGAVGAYAAVNLPVYVVAPAGWLNFWGFNVDRGADLGSVWYALSLLGWEVPRLSLVVALLLIGGGAAIAALLIWAPRRPRVAQGVFLVVVLFCLVNKVYSPQYMLWLLPLLVLARPVWRDWAVFTAAEVAYWWAVWQYLGDGAVYAGDGQPRLYIAAILLRVGVQVWLASNVVRDALRPESDPVRVGGVDDPHGGVLDRAPDAVWVPRLRELREAAWLP